MTNLNELKKEIEKEFIEKFGDLSVEYPKAPIGSFFNFFTSSLDRVAKEVAEGMVIHYLPYDSSWERARTLQLEKMKGLLGDKK